MSNIRFQILQEACKYQGYIKENSPMCGYKDGKIAKCWEDWQECKLNNCFLISKHKEVFQNQQSIFEMLNE